MQGFVLYCCNEFFIEIIDVKHFVKFYLTVNLYVKFLIVGLGNIGTEYAHTRHNIGFDVVDTFVLKAWRMFKTADWQK